MNLTLVGIILFVMLTTLILVNLRVNSMPKVIPTDKITYDFVVNVISGSFRGRQFNGFFSYEPSILTGKGPETIAVLTKME